MACARLGRFIEYIPESVTLGFTGGIAIVIATLQVKDFFGLPLEAMPEHYGQKLWLLASSISRFDGANLFVALVTLGVMLYWPKLKNPVPQHLPAVVIASVLGIAVVHAGYPIDTIGSRFNYLRPTAHPAWVSRLSCRNSPGPGSDRAPAGSPSRSAGQL